MNQIIDTVHVCIYIYIYNHEYNNNYCNVNHKIMEFYKYKLPINGI